jgi:hypothetical protein
MIGLAMYASQQQMCTLEQPNLHDDVCITNKICLYNVDEDKYIQLYMIGFIVYLTRLYVKIILICIQNTITYFPKHGIENALWMKTK